MECRVVSFVDLTVVPSVEKLVEKVLLNGSVISVLMSLVEVTFDVVKVLSDVIDSVVGFSVCPGVLREFTPPKKEIFNCRVIYSDL